MPVVRSTADFRSVKEKSIERLRKLAVWGIWSCLVIFMPQMVWSQEVRPIRIGATVSLSGKFKEPSLMVRDAIKLWETQVNQRGGLLDRPVQLLLYDDRGSAQLVRELYGQLLHKDKVDLVLSPYSTELTLAASEVTEQSRFVMLSGGASGDLLWQRGYQYIFGTLAPARRYLIGCLDIIARQGLETVAILYDESPFSSTSAQGAREWAERLGLRVSYYKGYREGKVEFPQILEECLKARADCLILCSYPEDSYMLLEFLRKAEIRPKALCQTVAPGLPSFYQQAGQMAEGVFGPSLWEPDARIPFPGTKEFIENFMAFARRPPSYHAGTAYAACQILEKAVTQIRSLDHRKLRDYILSLDTVTVIGRFRVDSAGMQTGHNPILIQWQDGKKEIVYPTSMQTAPPRF